MSVAADAVGRLDALPADYVSVRFCSQVTFRGVTCDSVSVADTVSGTYRLTHGAEALTVQWWPSGARPLERQVRLVPWHNVACIEPSSTHLARLLDAGDAARTRAAPPRQSKGGRPHA